MRMIFDEFRRTEKILCNLCVIRNLANYVLGWMLAYVEASKDAG